MTDQEKTHKQTVNLVIISDAVGDTAFNMVQAGAVQYPEVNFNYRRYPFITNKEKLEKVFDEIKDLDNLMIAFTLVTEEQQLAVIKFSREHHIKYVDLLSGVIDNIHAITGVDPKHEIGAVHQMGQNYFDRISAMEFAVMYDDGKDPKGFLEADVVLLGVSRTSKTPLSLFLANKNLKVANLPLVPQTHIPEEIYKVDPKKIIGLTNDPSVLNEIRRQRMISYGLNPDTTYSNMDSINKELASAQKLYDKLGCYVINVAHRSIEETAALILEHLGIDDYAK
ncbi:pyruvate, water dikinase regulatory protein [Lactobacillus hominis]|uniref:pyruvate, water dikinase regulatory protein n=1 Tax=Lactobacillus hominis TaxID=1203033 RepID=UPI0023F03334|nr:pyruvate, water dikinase regulatory protein [Lactobacillus hominis]